MKYLGFLFTLALIIVVAHFWGGASEHVGTVIQPELDPVEKLKQEGIIVSDKQQPSDWFYIQRAYPYEMIPPDKPQQAIEAAKQMQAAAFSKDRDPNFWQQLGPRNIPGRITDLAMYDSDTNTIYAGSAAGGVFKSTDHGQSWEAIFDDVGVQSVGAIAIDPTNPDILYVGTGEANACSDAYEGTGIYKSTNAGADWLNMGLPYSYHIGRIVVNPDDPNMVFVAVGGKHFGGTNPERGVYRSTDAGNSWERKLYETDSTCCIDLALHHSSGYVFAAMWEKTRYYGERADFGGMTSGLYRSTDYGETWTSLNGNGGFPASFPTMSRIGVTVDPYSSTVYASIIEDENDRLHGVYKSTNLGDTWTQLDHSPLDDMFRYFGWYFGQIRVAPGNPDLVYILGVELFVSHDGGITWDQDDEGIHVDHHAMILRHKEPYVGTYQVCEGCDGGVNYKWDHTTLDWAAMADMPNTQFYAVEMNHENPSLAFGGSQDNGTLRSNYYGPNNWDHILGGDGFYVQHDYYDTDVLYAESQYGHLYKSTNGGESFSSIYNNMDYDSDRHNWCTPYIIDPNDHNTLYYGSNRVWKTTNQGDNWVPISDDLTDGVYGTITTIAVSEYDSEVIYVGTNDGNVQVSEWGGAWWESRSSGLPDRYITRVAADPNLRGRAFVTVSGYSWSDPMPHIYETYDYGMTWTPIHGNLPDAPVNDVIPSPNDSDVIWIATDYGVYGTSDHGTTWEPLGQGMPIVPVHDIDYDDSYGMMIAGTHGRSMYILDFDAHAYLDEEPSIFCYPFHGSTGVPADTSIVLTNVGNAPTTYSVSIEYTEGPPGWLDISPPSGTINAVENNTEVLNVTATGPVSDVLLAANITVEYDAYEPSPRTIVIPIEFYCFDSFFSPQDEEIRTFANRLNISQVRIAHDEEGCKATYTEPPFDLVDMLFDGSLVISTGSDNNNYMCFFSDNYCPSYEASPNQHLYPLSALDCDSTTYVNPNMSGYRYATAEATTGDSTIAYAVEYYALSHPDSSEFYIMRYNVHAGPSFTADISNVAIGFIADFDIPDEPGGQIVNQSGTDPSRNLVYQQGQPDGSPDGYDTRFGGLAYYGNYTGGMGSDCAGGITVNNEYWIWPSSNFDQDELWNLLNEAGWTVDPWSGSKDLTSVLRIANGVTINDTSSLDFIVILALSNDGELKSNAGLLNNVDMAVNWINRHLVEGPYLCGDADASTGVDIDDVVYLINYIFSGGPAPVPLESGDANCAGGIDIDDVVYLISYIFTGGNAPCDPNGDEVPDC